MRHPVHTLATQQVQAATAALSEAAIADMGPSGVARTDGRGRDHECDNDASAEVKNHRETATVVWPRRA